MNEPSGTTIQVDPKSSQEVHVAYLGAFAVLLLVLALGYREYKPVMYLTAAVTGGFTIRARSIGRVTFDGDRVSITGLYRTRRVMSSSILAFEAVTRTEGWRKRKVLQIALKDGGRIVVAECYAAIRIGEGRNLIEVGAERLQRRLCSE